MIDTNETFNSFTVIDLASSPSCGRNYCQTTVLTTLSYITFRD